MKHTRTIQDAHAFLRGQSGLVGTVAIELRSDIDGQTLRIERTISTGRAISSNSEDIPYAPYTEDFKALIDAFADILTTTPDSLLLRGELKVFGLETLDRIADRTGFKLGFEYGDFCPCVMLGLFADSPHGMASYVVDPDSGNCFSIDNLKQG